MPAKIVVTSEKGGSKISLLGSSGKELLSSVVFKEPRAKGATLRALKGLLGETAVDDQTIKGPKRTPAAATKVAAEAPAVTAEVEAEPAPAPRRKSAAKKVDAPKKVAARKVSAAKTSPAKVAAAKVAAAKVAAEEVIAPKVAAARKSTKRATARP